MNRSWDTQVANLDADESHSRFEVGRQAWNTHFHEIIRADEVVVYFKSSLSSIALASKTELDKAG